MQLRPRVSVVVCNHNYGHFIEQALESVFAQQQPAFELIVVDDGSTDDSVQRIRRWADRLQLITQPNAGQMSAYNAGFAAVQGDIVVFLDSDDRLLPEALAHIAQAFNDADVARVHYRLALIDAQGKRTGAWIPTHAAEGDLSGALKRGVLFLAAPGSGNAYRVDVLRRLMPLPFDPRQKHGADFFTGYGMALLGRVKWLGDTPLGEYRVHNQQAVESLMFGNAKQTHSPTEVIQHHYAMLRDWLGKRCPEHQLALSPIADFSIEKQEYAQAIFGGKTYGVGLRQGWARLPRVIVSLRHRPSPWLYKAALVLWALVVLFMPRQWGWPVARFVCNPSSRTARS